jgi:putative sigma-54 modulation protein
MTLRVSGRRMGITPALREHAEAKAMKLAKYLDLLTAVDVIVDKCRLDHKRGSMVEMIAETRHRGRFVARVSGEAYGAVDACFRKLERLLSEEKQKLKNPRGLVAPRMMHMR